MGDFFNGTVAVVFALQVFYQRFVILYAMDIIRRVTDTVEVAADTDVVVIAQKVQHIVDMAVHTVDAGIVVIFFQELSGKGDTDQAVIGIDGFDLVVIEITRMTAKCFGIGMGSNDGLVEVSITSQKPAVAIWETSTSMPRRFISATT